MTRTAIFLSPLVVTLLYGAGTTAAGGGSKPQAMPAWVKDSQPTKPEDIPDGDYVYLRDWIDRNARPAGDYLVGLFKRHDVVIFGEAHNVREHKLIISSLIRRLYHEAGVRCVGWEFSTPDNNAELEKLTTSPKADPEALLDYARAIGGHDWDSKEHWDLVEAVRALNGSLPAGSPRMRLVGIDKPIDWVDVYMKLKTLAKDSPEMQALSTLELKRDVEMAENAERETLARGLKALLFVGRGHDETHFGLPPDKPYRRPIMAQVLHKKYGDRVFQVMADWGRFAPMNKAMESRYREPIGFDMYASPFASVLMVDMANIPTKMASLARGYVYFGPFERLHRNTTIPGFVTDAMFEKYKDYYCVEYGKPFQSAKEVDDYFMENKWSGVGR